MLLSLFSSPPAILFFWFNVSSTHQVFNPPVTERVVLESSSLLTQRLFQLERSRGINSSLCAPSSKSLCCIPTPCRFAKSTFDTWTSSSRLDSFFHLDGYWNMACVTLQSVSLESRSSCPMGDIAINSPHLKPLSSKALPSPSRGTSLSGIRCGVELEGFAPFGAPDHHPSEVGAHFSTCVSALISAVIGSLVKGLLSTHIVFWGSITRRPYRSRGGPVHTRDGFQGALGMRRNRAKTFLKE